MSLLDPASEPKVCVDGRVLPHSTIATFNENQGDLESNDIIINEI